MIAWEGEMIRVKAKQLKITQKLLAENLGVTKRELRNWINGKQPLGQYIIRLCTILNLEPNVFFFFNMNKNVEIPCYRFSNLNCKVANIKKCSCHDKLKPGETLEVSTGHDKPFCPGCGERIFNE